MLKTVYRKFVVKLWPLHPVFVGFCILLSQPGHDVYGTPSPKLSFTDSGAVLVDFSGQAASEIVGLIFEEKKSFKQGFVQLSAEVRSEILAVDKALVTIVPRESIAADIKLKVKIDAKIPRVISFGEDRADVSIKVYWGKDCQLDVESSTGSISQPIFRELLRFIWRDFAVDYIDSTITAELGDVLEDVDDPFVKSLLHCDEVR